MKSTNPIYGYKYSTATLKYRHADLWEKQEVLTTGGEEWKTFGFRANL